MRAQFSLLISPDFLRYTSKAIAMFQRIGAGDVYVFSMYTQEYNADAPYFNQRRAYVAYVDSGARLPHYGQYSINRVLTVFG